MPFFQNVFDTTFHADKQFGIVFTIPGNKNSSTFMVSGNTGPYNLSGSEANGSHPPRYYKNLTFNISLSGGSYYTAFSVDVSADAVSSSSVAAYNVVNSLNADATFSTYFDASVTSNGTVQVSKTNTIGNERGFKAYISNFGAETRLRFNAYAGIAEIPSYFARHTIANFGTYANSLGMLVYLDEMTDVDFAVIQDYMGTTWDRGDLKSDYELMSGKSGLFNFTKSIVDGSGRATQTIVYPAGSTVGDFSKKTTFSYTGADVVPTTIVESPYTLVAADIIHLYNNKTKGGVVVGSTGTFLYTARATTVGRAVTSCTITAKYTAKAITAGHAVVTATATAKLNGV